MTSAQSAAVAATSLVRVSITCNDRRLDIGIPSEAPLAELLPGFARNLGVLDPTLVHGGYSLHRADGTRLDADRGLSSQGITDGSLLTLICGALQPEPRVYDDVVEAVADAVEKQHSPWSDRDSAHTALGTSTAFLAVGALLLLGTGGGLFGSLIAAAAALLILVASAVLSRLKQPLAGPVLSLTAALFGAVSGYLLVPQQELESAGAIWGWPLAAAGAGALIVGGIGAFIIPERREICLVPAVSGLTIGAAGLITALTAAEASAVYGMTIAVAATLGNAIPWLSLSSSRIDVVSPQNDLEIFDDPAPIDADAIAGRFRIGQRVLLSGRAALAIVVLIATPVVVASGIPGAVLCTLAFVGVMLGSRQTYARADVLLIMGTGVLGLLVTGASAAITHPDWRQVLVLILCAAAAITVSLTLLSNKPHMRLGRVADGVDLFALALLLPLGVTVAGLA